jgi:hypothetical protein
MNHALIEAETVRVKPHTRTLLPKTVKRTPTVPRYKLVLAKICLAVTFLLLIGVSLAYQVKSYEYARNMERKDFQLKMLEKDIETLKTKPAQAEKAAADRP